MQLRGRVGKALLAALKGEQHEVAHRLVLRVHKLMGRHLGGMRTGRIIDLLLPRLPDRRKVDGVRQPARGAVRRRV